MRHLALVSAGVLLGATACGSATSLRSAVPLHNVLVYAKPDGLGRLASTNIAAANSPYWIWRARLDGSHAKRLATGNFPAVSPDGRWIAFGRGSDIFVMPAAGGAAERVYSFSGKYGLETPPTWAPDSRLLAFDTRDGLVVLDPFSHKTDVLPGIGAQFAFSPNSLRIAYPARSDKGTDLYVVPVRGGTPVRLTHGHKSGGLVVWGKPGIAFLRSYFHDDLYDIWLVDAKGRHVRRLTHIGEQTWPVAFSADGKELIAGPEGGLWTVDLVTGVERPLRRTLGVPYVFKGLSADGRTILAATCDRTDPYGEIVTVRATGGKPRVIVRGPCDASWNAR